MTDKIKVLVVGGDYSVESMFAGWGWDVTTKVGEEVDFVMFTGGADINPELYGHENEASYFNRGRDEFEIAVYEQYKDTKKLGICRGMQLLNVLNGGKMIQHISGHGSRNHPIIDLVVNKGLRVNSCHHQCVVPTDDMTVIAKSDDDIIEALWIPQDNALGIQGHPEWETPTENYFRELVSRYFKV